MQRTLPPPTASIVGIAGTDQLAETFEHAQLVGAERADARPRTVRSPARGRGC